MAWGAKRTLDAIRLAAQGVVRDSANTLSARSKATATVLAVPRWVNLAAHAVPLAVLPAGLWRMAMAVGVPVGFSGQLAKDWQPGLEASSYSTLLTLATEGLALMTLGLVKPWSEKVPSSIPLLGGRQVRTWAAVVPALLGALAVTALTTQVTFWRWGVFRVFTPPTMSASPRARMPRQAVDGRSTTLCLQPHSVPKKACEAKLTSSWAPMT